jgi:DNA-directed RNA polymerase subunit delta
MKRVIVDFSKLNQEILDLLVEKYPDGYMSKDIIAFRNSQNKMIEAVEVRTDETIYLVKVSQRLEDTMENYDDERSYDDDEFGESVEIVDEENEDDF